MDPKRCFVLVVKHEASAALKNGLDIVLKPLDRVLFYGCATVEIPTFSDQFRLLKYEKILTVGTFGTFWNFL
jgi:hypothetical protein